MVKLMKLCCPFCKEIHDLEYEEKTITEVVEGEKFEFVETNLRCNKLDLKKTDHKLKDPGRRERLMYVTLKAAYKNLPDGLKEKFKKEIEKQ